MKLIHKTLESCNRSMFIYYPEGKSRTPFKRCTITVLRENSDEASVRDLLDNMGMAKLAEENDLILAFPNPTESGWNYSLDKSGEDDLGALLEMQDSLAAEREIEPENTHRGMPPTIAEMLDTWHPMNDAKYLIGIGTGASMTLTMAACHPQFIAAVLAVGGVLSENVLKHAISAPVATYLCNDDETAFEYFIKTNDATEKSANEYSCPYNPVQKVIKDATVRKLDGELVNMVWDNVFRLTRRTYTGDYGDLEPRLDMDDAGFEIFEEDTRLGDQGGMPHTWFTYVPTSVKMNSDKKVPLMIFYHGGSDNPQEAADMSKFHELGEKEGFITVYPWGTNRASWSVMAEDDIWNPLKGSVDYDDVAFSMALIDYMIKNYPVDGQRVYLSGFSNGAGIAQVVAMLHPEKIAAICQIDSNWPGNRDKPTEISYKDVKPMRLAMEKKKSYDYRMPVWYTYGTREPSYPVYEYSSQQHQYDFWKRYNNITVKPTPGKDNPHPCGCGVPGDIVEYLKPSKRHPHHNYDVHRFFTNDEEPKNYYNYVMMRDKSHDVAQMDPYLGWEYVKQFKRNPDGSVGKVE